jgi:DNA-binding response OmpR family regulator
MAMKKVTPKKQSPKEVSQPRGILNLSRILIADDSPELLESVTFLIKDEGHKVEFLRAFELTFLLKALKEHKKAFLNTEFELVDGLSLIRIVRNQTKLGRTIKVILVDKWGDGPAMVASAQSKSV